MLLKSGLRSRHSPKTVKIRDIPSEDCSTCGECASRLRIYDSEICGATTMRTHQHRGSRPNGSSAPRQRPWSANNQGSRPHRPGGLQDAQRRYEHYLALAQAEARAGNEIAAENYYQHAEHYYRVMSSDRTT